MMRYRIFNVRLKTLKLGYRMKEAWLQEVFCSYRPDFRMIDKVIYKFSINS